MIYSTSFVMKLIFAKTQIDLVLKIESGLIDAEERLKNIYDIGFVYLNEKDVVRHELVQRVIKAYEKQMDINHTIIIKSNHWSRRLVKVKKIINKVFKYKKLLDFNYDSNYFCNIILMNDYFIRKFNKLYKKQNKSTDVLTFISKIKKIV